MEFAEQTLYKYVKAPMNLGMGDRIAFLNIVVRDLQAGGARIMSTTQTDDGWSIEFMGPESMAEEVVQDEQS